MSTRQRGKHPPQSTLHEWLDYDPETGIFIWKKDTRPNRKFLGKQAGCLKKRDGYVVIAVRGYGPRAAHRLAWCYVHGDYPDCEIDHIDNNRANNAIDNLRLATRQEQCRNTLSYKDSFSGLKGAFFHARIKRWYSAIKLNGKSVFLGCYDTADEAHAAYCAAAARYFGEFANAGYREIKKSPPVTGPSSDFQVLTRA